MIDESHDQADSIRAARGDLAAFERLHRRHVARVFGLARRVFQHVEAEDVTQETFLRAWRSLGRFRGDAAFGSWLFRIATRLVLDRLTARCANEPIDFDTAAPARSVSDRIDLAGAVAELPEGARLIFILHDAAGCDHAEIASALDLSIGTSKSQLHRARALLRARLEPTPETLP